MFFKSGNPGYILGKPVLVAESESGSVRKLNQYGFRFFAQDPNGQCFKNVDNVGSLSYNSADFNFGNEVQMSCGIKLNADQLKSYCTTGTIGALQKS